MASSRLLSIVIATLAPSVWAVHIENWEHPVITKHKEAAVDVQRKGRLHKAQLTSADHVSAADDSEGHTVRKLEAVDSRQARKGIDKAASEAKGLPEGPPALELPEIKKKIEKAQKAKTSKKYFGVHKSSDLPKNLWMYWDGPEENKNEVHRACLEMWPKLNPGWNLTVIDNSTVKAMFPDLDDLFTRYPRTVQLRSDMIRLWFLAKLGGVWADATLLPLDPLDTFAQALVEPSGFFSFDYPPNVASWFLIAKPKNPLMEEWLANFVKKWEMPEDQKKFEYFEVHYTFEDIIDKKSGPAFTAFNGMPKITAFWPLKCGLEKCPGYWTGSEIRPPMIKRPLDLKDEFDEEWYSGYQAFINGTINDSKAGKGEEAGI